MSESSNPLPTAIPPDDPARQLAIVDLDDPKLRHIAVVGDTYRYRTEPLQP